MNQTRKTILAENIIIPQSLLDQSLGLLKYKKPVAMLLKTRFGIHTFGMKYSIDVIIVDKKKHIVEMKESLKPNRIFVWNLKYSTVIELPEGTIKKTKTAITDILITNTSK
jgi:uncharacterized membrane protein (UPF0127 family)